MHLRQILGKISSDFGAHCHQSRVSKSVCAGWESCPAPHTAHYWQPWQRGVSLLDWKLPKYSIYSRTLSKHWKVWGGITYAWIMFYFSNELLCCDAAAHTIHLFCSLHDQCCSVSLRLPCHSLTVCKHSLFATVQWSNDTVHKNCPRFNFAVNHKQKQRGFFLRGWPTFEQSDIMHVLTGILWPQKRSN